MKKVTIWVDEHHREVEAWGSVDVFEGIKELLMDTPGEVGELVPDDDRQWGGYRRIVVHISPPIRKKKYVVELHADVTQFCHVEVEAEDEDQARAKAYVMACTQDHEWQLYHMSDADIHVQDCNLKGEEGEE